MEQLATNEKKDLKRKSKKMTCVRFSEKEYKKISAVAQKKNKSIPELLKLCYETVEGNPIEIPRDELREYTLQLIRIGNNVNTALRKINSGEYHMLEDIKGSLESSSLEIKILKTRVGKIL